MHILKRMLGISLASVLIFFSIFWWQHQKNIRLIEFSTSERLTREQKLTEEFWKKLSLVSEQKELSKLTDDYDKLPTGEQEKVGPIINLKKAIYTFDEAENKLMQYIKLAQATAGDDKKISPLAKEVFNESISLYQQSKKIIDQLEEVKDDNEYNHCLYYTRMEIYYRVTQLIAIPEEVPEFFNQIVESGKKALLVKLRDVDTEINLEILSKNKGLMLSKANFPGDQKIQQLQQKGVGKGSRKGKF